MIHRIAEILPRPERDFIYDVIGHLPRMRLCVDVGAAAGQATRRIRLAGGTDMQVLAFEPFPGNEPFFEKETHGLTNVTLVRKAVGSEVGTAVFFVPQVVKGTERNWEDFKGYSSTGFLIEWPSTADWMKDARRAIRTVAKIILGRFSLQGQKLVVQATSLDTEFAGRRIDFLKIDVQGGEGKVLLGAKKLLASGAIPLIYLEWNGHRPVVEILRSHSYVIFDSVYLVFPRGTPRQRFEELGLEYVSDVALSSGQPAYEMILNRGTMSPEEVVNRARAIGLSGIQTDLVAVHPGFLQAFHSALSELGASSSRNRLYADVTPRISPGDARPSMKRKVVRT